MNKVWKDNAFWDNAEKTRAMAILEVTTSEGVTSTQVLTVNKVGPSGEENPDWTDLMEAIGEEKIDANTEERIARKAEEERIEALRKEEMEKSKKLEKLFDAKLQAFEIDEVKNSKNRQLKASLRRAKSIVEVNIYAMMIVMEQLENDASGEK